jgi:hypothetical protein
VAQKKTVSLKKKKKVGFHFIPKLRGEIVKVKSVINIHAAVTVTNLITNLCASDMI